MNEIEKNNQNEINIQFIENLFEMNFNQDDNAVIKDKKGKTVIFSDVFKNQLEMFTIISKQHEFYVKSQKKYVF